MQTTSRAPRGPVQVLDPVRGFLAARWPASRADAWFVLKLTPALSMIRGCGTNEAAGQRLLLRPLKPEAVESKQLSCKRQIRGQAAATCPGHHSNRT